MIKKSCIKINLIIDFFKWRYINTNIKQQCNNIIKKFVLNLIYNNIKYNSILLSVLFSKNIKLFFYNYRYKNINSLTNILSFSFSSHNKLKKQLKEITILGDIAISYEEIIYNSSIQYRSIINYFNFILIHGILHILGYKHNTKNYAYIMYFLERNYK